MKKILMPIEKCKEECSIVEVSYKIAKKFDSQLTLFYVDNSEELYVQLKNELPVDLKNISKSPRDESLEEILNSYRLEGINVELKIVKGTPAEEILKEANEGDYDLVIMRTHGMKASRIFLLGSITNKVVHHINKPILVVR